MPLWLVPCSHGTLHTDCMQPQCQLWLGRWCIHIAFLRPLNWPSSWSCEITYLREWQLPPFCGRTPFTLYYPLVKEVFFRFISNRLLLSPPSHSTPADSRVEWAYAFDVHTNAFFPFYLTLYLAQLFLLPVIFKDNWVCLWVGNTLYLAAYVPCSIA